MRRAIMKKSKWSAILILCLLALPIFGLSGETDEDSALLFLLPTVEPWTLSEAPQIFIPGTLFEYINGAAEAYLSYDFKELLVAQFKKNGSEASLTVEIYDMGSGKNAFGIYSAERFPESMFIAAGNQGYIEEGALNFLTGHYYIKLICYDCGEDSESVLRMVSGEIDKNVQEKGSLPALLQSFPREGLVANSEKFILRNFLGFSFLHDGYLASYSQGGAEFDCFLIEAEDETEVKQMLELYIGNYKKNNQVVEEIPSGYHIKDRYSYNIFFKRAGHLLFGVLRVRDGFEDMGLAHLALFYKSLHK